MCPMQESAKSALSSVPEMWWHMWIRTSAAARKVLHLRDRPAVAGVDERAPRMPQPEGERRQVGLEVARIADLERPLAFLHHVAELQLGDARIGPLPWQHAAARFVDREAAAMARARNEVRLVDSVVAEQLLGHARERRGSINLELGNLACTLVPAREHEAGIVAAMVVVQVREEEMGDARGGNAELEQPVVCAEAVIQDDDVAADLHHVTGAHSPQRRRRCPSPKQPNSHAGLRRSHLIPRQWHCCVKRAATTARMRR